MDFKDIKKVIRFIKGLTNYGFLNLDFARNKIKKKNLPTLLQESYDAITLLGFLYKEDYITYDEIEQKFKLDVYKLTSTIIESSEISGTNITGGTIAGAYFKTSTGGGRIEITSDLIKFYSGDDLISTITTGPFTGGDELRIRDRNLNRILVLQTYDDGTREIEIPANVRQINDLTANYIQSNYGYTVGDYGTVIDGEKVGYFNGIENSKHTKKNTDVISSSTYSISSDDHIILCDTSSNTVTITIPTAQIEDGREIVIKDYGGNANNENITIETEGSELIDGQSDQTINSNYDSVTLICQNEDLYII